MYQNCLKEKDVLLPIATNQDTCFICLKLIAELWLLWRTGALFLQVSLGI